MVLIRYLLGGVHILCISAVIPHNKLIRIATSSQVLCKDNYFIMVTENGSNLLEGDPLGFWENYGDKHQTNRENAYENLYS